MLPVQLQNSTFKTNTVPQIKNIVYQIRNTISQIQNTQFEIQEKMQPSQL